MHQRIHTLRADRKHIPEMIKRMSLMMFLFVLGRWMGGDVFFSVYVDMISPNALLVSVMGAVLAIVKMVFSLAMGNMSTKADFAKMVRWGKRVYVICGVLFAAAGFFRSPAFLVIAVIFNGVGSAMLFTVYQYYFRQHSNGHNRYAVLGLMYTSINGAYVIGALIASLLVLVMPLRSMYLFISLFALVSLWWWKRLEDDVNPLAKSMTRRIGLWRQMMYELLSGQSYHHSLHLFRTYGLSFASRLGLVSLLNASDYVWFLFVPLLAVANDFSLSEIATLFAVMRVPAMLSYFIGDWEDKLPYQRVMLVWLGGLALCFVWISLVDHFGVLMIIGVVMGFLITLLRPILVGNVLAEANEHDAGIAAGTMAIFARLGEIVWSLLFGLLVTFVSMQGAFVVFAGIIWVVFFAFVLTFYKK